MGMVHSNINNYNAIGIDAVLKYILKDLIMHLVMTNFTEEQQNI